MKTERWQRVQEVYLDAADRLPESRGPFLDEACADDDELLREVQSLLAADQVIDPVFDATLEDLVLLMEDPEGEPPAR